MDETGKAGAGASRGLRPLSYTGHMVRNHVRLWISAAVAALTYWGLRAALPGIDVTLGFLLAFNAGAVLWLGLVMHMVVTSTPGMMRARSGREDEGAGLILVLSAVATVASLAAVAVEAGYVAGAWGTREQHVALAVGTLVVGWFFFHSVFTLHYARLFYHPKLSASGPCLSFPGTSEPDYWDFIYFGFNIGTAIQTSDVEITSRAMRKFVIVHQIASYLFNAAVIALGVNVAAGLMGGS